MSAYPLTTETVSATLSPLEAELEEESAKPSVFPPRESMADSKLSLVLVDGSKNRVARILFLQTSLYLDLSFFMSFARSMRLSISSVERSRIFIRSLIFLPSFHRKDCRGIL